MASRPTALVRPFPLSSFSAISLYAHSHPSHSACTCPGEDHPGPDLNKPIGRAAPEIDIFEAQKNKVAFGGRVTQSAQMAPFTNMYYYPNTSADITIHDANATSLNTYRGSALCVFFYLFLFGND